MFSFSKRNRIKYNKVSAVPKVVEKERNDVDPPLEAEEEESEELDQNQREIVHNDLDHKQREIVHNDLNHKQREIVHAAIVHKEVKLGSPEATLVRNYDSPTQRLSSAKCRSTEEDDIIIIHTKGLAQENDIFIEDLE